MAHDAPQVHVRAVDVLRALSPFRDSAAHPGSAGLPRPGAAGPVLPSAAGHRGAAHLREDRSPRECYSQQSLGLARLP